MTDKDITILIVDDIPSNLQLLSSHLSEFTTAIAKNGEKAIQRTEILKPDLILLDIQMPGMDGYEVCRRLKEREDTCHIPIIIMTALSDSRSKVEGFANGAVDYITKPIDKAELMARVRTHLNLSGMRKELEEKNRILKANAEQQKRVDKIMRHDLKGPLQAMINIPELLLHQGNLDESQKQLAQLLEEAAQNMLNMINSSLTLYKIEQGIYKPVFERQLVEKVIQQANVSLAYKYPSVNLCISISHGCSILGEELLFITLFSNLLKNAYEASTSINGHEEILISSIGSNEERTKITITNKGSVPLEIRDTFFDEFSTSGKEFGTGLGTYSAKLITEALRGTIELDSTVDNQTSIILTFDK